MDGRTGFSSFPLATQSYVLNSPGYSGGLWAQGLSRSTPNTCLKVQFLDHGETYLKPMTMLHLMHSPSGTPAPSYMLIRKIFRALPILVNFQFLLPAKVKTNIFIYDEYQYQKKSVL